MRYFLDTQLYSYLANGTIPRARWEAALERRELWLSCITAYELLEGLLNAGPHAYRLSLAAVQEAAAIPSQRILPYLRWRGPSVRRWMEAAGWGELPRDFAAFRRRIQAGRGKFLGEIRRFMAAVMPHWRIVGDPLFSPEWRRAAGPRRAAENLRAAFVFETALLQRAMRIRYNLEKHPSDYLDYLQLQYLRHPDLVFITADRKLARLTSRSLESDRILGWDELEEELA